jgi:hypothetical protein
MENKFLEKYGPKIEGAISCFDRVIISGTLNKWGYSEGMFSYLMRNNIRIMDFPKFAKGYNEKIREKVEAAAKAEGIKIENIRKPGRFDKEEEIKKILSRTDKKEGIVHIYSSMEISGGYEGKYDHKNKKVSLHNITPRCLNYYIYFIDKVLGLCFVRIPTWIPFRIQFYFNGHNYLAYKLRKNKIDYKMNDNAFIEISGYQSVQKLSDDIRAKDFHIWLDKIIERYIPFLEETGQSYRWTILQAEYSTDIIFREKEDLRLLYEELIINCIHSVKPENIATFFSRALAAQYKGEVGTRYNKQIQGTRIKHYMGANSIKMYDKASVVLRIETTVNDIYQFQTFRSVVTRSGEKVNKYAVMKRSIYSLYDLGKFCQSANSRYMDFISCFEENLQGEKNLLKISEKIYWKDRSYKGFNFFDSFDANVLIALDSGEFNINGFRNKSIRKKLQTDLSSSMVTRILKRLWLHGLIKKVKNSFKYYLTNLGKKVIAIALMLKEKNIIPALSV